MPVPYHLYVIIENAFPLLFSVFNTGKDGHVNFLKCKIDISGSFWKLRESYCDRLLRRIPFFRETIVGLPHNLKALVRPCYGETSIAYEIFASSAYDRFVKIQKGDVVIDVGANIGFFTLKASTAVGSKGRVLAIEPSRSNYEILKYNVGLNKLDNVRTFKCALGDNNGSAILYLSSFGSGTHSTVFRVSSHTETVVVNTLDTIVAAEMESEKYDHIDLIKIDAEGSEYRILRGAVKTLTYYHPRLSIESTNEIIRTQCKKLLNNLKYEVRILDPYLYGS